MPSQYLLITYIKLQKMNKQFEIPVNSIISINKNLRKPKN